MEFPPWGTKILTHKAVGTVVVVVTVVSAVALPLSGYWSWLVYLASLVAIIVTLLVVARARSVQFLASISDGPDNLSIPSTLERLRKHRGQLHVLGRTSLQWLCADESLWEAHDAAYMAARSARQQCIKAVVLAGANIHFILQSPGLAYPFEGQGQEESRKRLAEQHQDAVESFREIAAELPAGARRRFHLSYSLQSVDNSMTRMIEDGNVVRFVLDLGTQFKKPEGTNWKPVLVFARGAVEMAEYDSELDRIIQDSLDVAVYERERGSLLDRLTTIEHRHPHMSQQRQDGSAVMARFAAALHQRHSVPPMSVQVLVTNQCSTKCKMCRHWEIPPVEPMARWELRNVFEMIAMMGTKSIIVSGGEPLMRADLKDVLEDAQSCGLKIGLLTNGVGEELMSPSEEAAKSIAGRCDWIQVSLDAFDRDTYCAVRGEDAFDAAVATLHRLSKRAPEKVEACYTVQAGNIAEFEALRQAAVLEVLPPGVGLRFKFAHGPDASPSFLIGDADRVAQALSSLRDGDWSGVDNNIDYLTAMVGGGYFTYAGLASGTPVGSWVTTKAAGGYRCRILSLTCKIDAVGDVYPCCFLFDDNNSGASQIRTQFRVGSLRRNQAVVEPTSEDNPLADLWYTHEALNYWRGKTLPVNDEACTYCTRHAYQNEYLNEYAALFTEGASYGIAEHVLARETETNPDAVWV